MNNISQQLLTILQSFNPSIIPSFNPSITQWFNGSMVQSFSVEHAGAAAERPERSGAGEGGGVAPHHREGERNTTTVPHNTIPWITLFTLRSIPECVRATIAKCFPSKESIKANGISTIMAITSNGYQGVVMVLNLLSHF